ncbi:hypothetical protein A8C46_00430 [Ligilactobacillus salivarius]|uniref:hypothetical protein n=1 Tax=Ligilactobacillus salivarius TaxID=1624 RepID=UPI000A2D5E96|nr:hypothetical protein [Ligilactobacillus salivarius]OTF89738.1 hypothetical protein A8C38_00210 [Ligilactobacillus salivarius]PAY43573.1 hypothetical protein A8C39_00390 [Ligilactobacillus salivarius]PAY49387.1 hypothetical protein A8C42_00540 [Ligilactobacillus salivarius]PAY58067.1 hypothetical protein A8C46_00430 [Ligilactobacillus salivarius]PAY58756.1 hypothetical protein A8C40_01420 [Ligilactobacillus salivarius]
MEKEKILVEVKQFERELQMQNKVLAALNTVDDVKLVVIQQELLDMFKKKLNMKLKVWGADEGMADSYLNVKWNKSVMVMSLDKEKIKNRLNLKRERRFEFDKYTLDEVLTLIKEEIYRQGIEENPRATVYRKNLQIGKAPVPIAMKRRYNLSWDEVLERLGLKQKRIKKPTEDILDELKAEIIRLGMKYPYRRHEYEEKRNKETSPSPTTVMVRTGKKWKEIIREIMY